MESNDKYFNEVAKIWMKKYKKAKPTEQQDLIGLMNEANPKAHEYHASEIKPKMQYTPKAPQETLLDKERKLEAYEAKIELNRIKRQKAKEQKERTA